MPFNYLSMNLLAILTQDGLGVLTGKATLDHMLRSYVSFLSQKVDGKVEQNQQMLGVCTFKKFIYYNYDFNYGAPCNIYCIHTKYTV